MYRISLILMLLIFVTLPAWAQQGQEMKQSDSKKGIPSGWMIRFDHSSASMDNVKFNINGGTYHFEAGGREAAIYYKPDMTAEGGYSYQGTFTQLQKTGHPEAYGLFIGGKNLQDKDQQYLYFLIRQDGKYLIKRRTGSDTESINGWTASDAVKALGSDGTSTNQLSINCDQDAVKFMANGVVLKSIPRSELNYIDGIAGLRINHHLHVDVKGLSLNSAD